MLNNSSLLSLPLPSLTPAPLFLSRAAGLAGDDVTAPTVAAVGLRRDLLEEAGGNGVVRSNTSTSSSESFPNPTISDTC